MSIGSLDKFTISDNVEVKPCESGWLITWPENNGSMVLSGAAWELGGVNWNDAAYLVMEVTGLENFNLAFVWLFLSGETMESPYTMVNVGVIPGIRTKITFPMDALDSNKMFMPRTPGRLKEIVLGRGVALNQVKSFVITTKKCHKPQRMILHDIYLTQEEPDYIINHEPIIDKLGQLKTRDWNGKTLSGEAMIARLIGELEKYGEGCTYKGWSQYGGDLSVKWESTGFFRTHFDGKRWFLADPEGYRFISTGLDCCIPGDMGYITGMKELHDELPDKDKFSDAYNEDDMHSGFAGDCVCFSIANLIRTFGEDWKNEWTRLTKNRLIDWHYNTIGNWSDREFVQKARLPYVWPLKDFPSTKKRIFRDFPDVFDDEYEENAKVFARQLNEFKGDPYMIGYFLRNEPEWAFVNGLLIAEKVLENPENSACKQLFIEDLRKKYGDIKGLNYAWKMDYYSFDALLTPQMSIAALSDEAKDDAREFSKKMIRRYVSVPSLACKAVDPDHMNLGMRYSMLTDPILLEGYEYFDVFSLNGYQESPYEEVQQAGELTGKPVIIGEFHFGAIDVGMMSAGICSVATQKDRGLAYRMYYEKGCDSPYFVGAHYFVLNDQAALGRFDGENMQIGMVDVCHKPYDGFVDEVRKVNGEIYKIADGKRTLPEPEIHRIPRLMGF